MRTHTHAHAQGLGSGTGGGAGSACGVWGYLVGPFVADNLHGVGELALHIELELPAHDLYKYMYVYMHTYT